MNYKHNFALFGIIIFAIGIFVGWLIWGTCGKHIKMMGCTSTSDMHMMHGGSMMSGGMEMQEMMDGMTAMLEGKNGDEFDKAFIDEMIVHHQGAVAMANMVLKISKRPELIKLANDIISAQTAEIKMMQGWRQSWFNQ